MTRNHIKYSEGQWFAVPLRRGGYALGIIVRGNYHTKGGLGYFFGPRYSEVPQGFVTSEKTKDNAIYIARFGDLGIITGEWPLIVGGKLFTREEWPVPLFHRVPLPGRKAILVEYRQDYSGNEKPIRETFVPATDKILRLPEDGRDGSGVVEIVLDKLLDNLADSTS